MEDEQTATRAMNLLQKTQYLDSLINKTLRVHTTDTRIFVGVLKCTDRERNVILSLTHEYRHPPAGAVVDAAAAAAAAAASAEVVGVVGEKGAGGAETEKVRTAAGNIKLDMLRRFVGLVVVPGQHITKIEVES